MQLRLLTATRILFALLAINLISDSTPAAESGIRSRTRQTPLVQAVQGCSASVVNLRGRKTVPADDGENGSGKKLKQVNGMGTGVVFDSRGYVLTNYHVVQGVKEIQVTTSDNEKTTARLLAHDPKTDLAILKINTRRPLPEIKIGTSSDLMLAETVIAVGNAYGYEHTVTVGIISQLGRTVQVNDHQIYRNLIQTDAAINPGNSGGPLLNLDGEMIGINVAVRIGAQGIAFAIPVNDALDVAAKLMADLTNEKYSHGLQLQTVFKNNRPRLLVESVEPDSPAALAGIDQGDLISSINKQSVQRELDFYTNLLGTRSSDPLQLSLIHDSKTTLVELPVESRPPIRQPDTNIGWETLGVKLVLATEAELANEHPNYKRGLRVTHVRPGSPAETEGVLPGDILVAMHGYKTESLENLAYVLQQSDVFERDSFMFYILRNKEPFWGQMRVARK